MSNTRKSNTDHHLDYVISLLDLIAYNGVNDSKFEKRYNKLIYCMGKLRYNLSVHRTTNEYVKERLADSLEAVKDDKFIQAVIGKAKEQGKWLQEYAAIDIEEIRKELQV